jgi:hypothetical protein
MTQDFFLEFFPDEIKQEIESKKAPDILFHYTDGGAVINIVRAKELWATSVQYMNDPHEIHFFMSEAIKYCNIKPENIPKEKLDFIPPLSEISNSLYREEDVKNKILMLLFEQTIELLNYHSGSGNEICLISLSEEGDLLSQWRAYAPNSGYCIGFDTRGLEKLPACQPIAATPEFFSQRAANYKLLPCLYRKREKQIIYASEVIDKAIKYVDNNVRQLIQDTHSIRPLKDGARVISTYLSNTIIFLSSVLKDASFTEESEWRLVSQPMPYTELSYRSRGSLIVPYHVFSLSSNGANVKPSIPIRKIHVGPASEREKRLSKQTLIGLLRKYEVVNPDDTNISIVTTETTFTKSP